VRAFTVEIEAAALEGDRVREAPTARELPETNLVLNNVVADRDGANEPEISEIEALISPSPRNIVYRAT
jgi:hypothetical protein